MCPLRKWQCQGSETFGAIHSKEPPDGPSNLSEAVVQDRATSACALRGIRFAMCPVRKHKCRQWPDLQLPSSSSPETHYYYNLAFKAFRQTAFTERDTFASLENEPCRWWWWRRSVLLLKKSLSGFYSRLESKHCSWWRPRRAFQLFKKYVLLSREIDSRPGNESC